MERIVKALAEQLVGRSDVRFYAHGLGDTPFRGHLEVGNPIPAAQGYKFELNVSEPDSIFDFKVGEVWVKEDGSVWARMPWHAAEADAFEPLPATFTCGELIDAR